METAGEARKTLKRYLFVPFLLLAAIFQLQGCSQPFTGTSFAQKPSGVKENDAAISASSPTTSSEFQFTGAVDRYGPMVRKYSDQFSMDWVLVMAVIKQESKFDHEAVSHSGAYGLMQIMPITQMELVDKLGIIETVTPRNNIKAGIYHLRSLSESFRDAPREDRIRLMLAAYNAGIGRIQDAQKIAAYLGNDPKRWQSIRDALPLLSRNNYTLHGQVWEDGRPPSGYFRNWRQTVDYVGSVSDSYQEFSLALR
jgi:membrane-bound lytic murein transglycosylase F